ncbi:MAG: sulfotransferase family protein [Gordonia sp. (in: high G+C Gram-positive bacteria)]
MQRVFLHIGLPKTGTTHLQDRLWRNRDLALDQCGLLYPGTVISDHFHAAVHLQPERYLDWVDPAFAHAWPTMLAQMKAWPQTSLISHELYATAQPDHIARLLADLSFADEVHVVATVRDLARQLPSVWQENVKNQRQASFAEFVASVRAHADPGPDRPRPSEEPAVGRADPPAPPEEPFWEFQDHVGILGRWAAAVGPQRVHVVTVPPGRGGPGDGLWERFLAVLDVDPAVLTIEVPSLNSSLSAAQAEFLRALNRRLQPADIAWERYERVVKGEVIGQILFQHPGGTPQGLTGPQRVWASNQAAAMVAALGAAGYPVSGALRDLTVSRDVEPGLVEPTTAEVLDTALDTFAELVKLMPMPARGPGVRTRARDVVRRVRRRALGLRRSRGGSL